MFVSVEPLAENFHAPQKKNQNWQWKTYS